MITVRWERYPLVEQHSDAHRWLQFIANIGRAWNTVDAYGRAVDDHLAFCLTIGVTPEEARPDAVAAWIGEMHQRPNPSGGVGLANSTIQVRIVEVRSFYDFLVGEGIRERNPVCRGQSSRRGGRAKQGLVWRVEKAPWIPNERAWDRILRTCENEPVRNRLMVTFAYDGALRREELRAQIGPDPRIIDEVSWAKLMAAGPTLNGEELNEYGSPRAKAAAESRRLYYPIAMVRALVGVWLFTGCRIDEIRRLDIDCIDRDEGATRRPARPSRSVYCAYHRTRPGDSSPNRSTRSSASSSTPGSTSGHRNPRSSTARPASTSNSCSASAMKRSAGPTATTPCYPRFTARPASPNPTPAEH
ncbi:tyrosine-type recombinase/integrase [Lentzea sp. NPDC060358]|uniref:tyrosine-type recombinase/integrase n=1 Tax=Lentzea sp. NPDC060358 TaxID=3347103 RepID=UPI00364FBB2A